MSQGGDEVTDLLDLYIDSDVLAWIYWRCVVVGLLSAIEASSPS